MRHFLLILTLIFLVSAGPGPSDFYSFKLKDIDGKEFAFSALKGKKVLIVNTASQCGYTSQYKELEELYKKYKDKDFVIIAVPANNFGGQEPGSNAEIKDFCSKNYGVTFPVLEKISVKGDDAHPLFKWLTSKSENGVSDATIRWNFNKFFIDEKGNWVSWFPSKTNPVGTEITSLIEKK